jgi:hypothetical protein
MATLPINIRKKSVSGQEISLGTDDPGRGRASPHPLKKRVAGSLQACNASGNSIFEVGLPLFSCRNYFFLLFGFLTSFFAPCREAAIGHHLFP